MPARQPFTALCRAAARSRSTGRVDLHAHTTHSDGSYTPPQLVELARRSGLAALAITDHDILDGVPAAQAAAVGSDLEIIAGVEISAEQRGQELHLLGYFIQLDDAPLLAALARLRQHRLQRFQDMVERLRGCGVSLEEKEVRAQIGAQALGRRHLAELLIKARRASTVREAFARYLRDGGRVALPKVRLPVEEAIALVRGAGGVASLAHPSYDCKQESLAELRTQGLGAVEVEYPSFGSAWIRQLRAWAAELGLAVTGGSDCHGPGHFSRSVGACSVTGDELAVLRQQASKKG
jgi:predicted metal-dependent phosphoesterase TrpH